MQMEWLKGLKGPERDNFKVQVLQSKKVLDKLKEICYNIRIENESVSKSDYDSPSWSHKQAHANGFSDALRTIELLCTMRELD